MKRPINVATITYGVVSFLEIFGAFALHPNSAEPSAVKPANEAPLKR
jgi:hypothetical protein